MSRSTLEINGKTLAVSNLGKDLYPSYGFTKADVIKYYSLIAPFILPHLKDRALTLKRYPDGVLKEYFYEKRCPVYRPGWVKTAGVPYGEKKQLTACVINSLEALIWVENLASIELHVPLARAASPGTPDSVVFDLDPGGNMDALYCAKVALLLKQILDDMNLESLVKTSGKKGLHIYVPLNSKNVTFEDTKKFSMAVAGLMEKTHPGLVTSKMAKEYRKGRVFINWSQNDASKTMACVYSLRAGEKPSVSFPLEWGQLEKLARQKNPEKFQVLHSEAVARAGKSGDLFREVLTKKQKLPVL